MLLHDMAIRQALTLGEIVIDPYDPKALQPSSVDVHLGAELLIFKNSTNHIDPKQDNTKFFSPVTMGRADIGAVIWPGDLVLATTVEHIEVGTSLAARVEGKSSLARLGLSIHTTAGFIDPGFKGQVTLELSVTHSASFRIYPGMPIGQLCFFRLTGAAVKPYSGKYQNQTGPQASQYHKNFDQP